MRVDVSETVGRILIATGQAVEVVAPSVGSESGWPRVLDVATPWGMTVKVNAAAPLHPRWYPGLMASIVGQNGVLNDPSNGASAVPPLPLRSEAGFPLFYALAGGKPIDTASVCVGDQTFNSDSAALDYLVRSGPVTQAQPGVYVGAGERSALTPELLAEFKAQQSDRDRGVWLNNHSPQVAKELLAGDHMSHEQSTAAFNAAQGYKV